MAPLAALMEQVSHHSDEVSIEDVKAATLTATELIGNASAHISHLRREKLVSSINKSLLPLAQEDGAFLEVAPYLFGPDFSKRGKDHLDQVKSLKAATLPARHNIPQGTNRQGPVFRIGLSSGRGLAKGRDGGPTPFNQKHHSGERNPKTTHTFLCKKCISSYAINTQCDCSQGHCTHRKPVKPSRSVGSFHGQLADFNKGPVGPEYNNRVRDRICLSTLPIQKTPPNQLNKSWYLKRSQR